jgi:RNA polymerase sigma-70 factor, ECF subfamily
MTKAIQIRQRSQGPVMTPVANEPPRTKTPGRVKAAGCAGHSQFSATHIVGKLGEQERPLGADASDEALINAIGRGERHAMALLYGRHSVRVYRFVLRLIGDATVAEDIVSDVFLDVWLQAKRFKARAQVSTWLLAIARNKSLSEVRRRRDKEMDCEPVEMADPADDPEVSVQKAIRSEVIRRCLSQLSAIHREVIDLVYYHDKSVAEIAKIVGVPANTVKTRMFHARQRMGHFLSAAGHDGI